MKKYVRYILMSAITLLVMGACSGEQEPERAGASDSPSIYVACNKMVTADNIGDDDTDETAPIIIEDFAEGSLLYFSQMSQNSLPNFDDQLESADSYLYIYKYRANPKATWESGENFVNSDNTRFSFDWERTVGAGPSGNAFKFFGFYFPVDNRVRWNVETDQTGGPGDQYSRDNFMKSDIMGAYHATSSIFTRMRFRLFHLMTYLKVTLYVPVYKAEFSEPDKQNYSGFDAGALKGGYLMNALTNFNIEWTASKSSDTEAPLVQTPADGPKSNIKMYRHRDNEEDISDLPVKNFYNGPVDGITDDIDQVRAYNFSVIFPTQSFGDNFLCFALTTPGGDTKYYYFSGSQILGANGENYGLTQGTLQQLYLYLPRKTNQTVLVGAKILPWQDAQTDMTVTKKEKE